MIQRAIDLTATVLMLLTIRELAIIWLIRAKARLEAQR